MTVIPCMVEHNISIVLVEFFDFPETVLCHAQIDFTGKKFYFRSQRLFVFRETINDVDLSHKIFLEQLHGDNYCVFRDKI